MVKGIIFDFNGTLYWDSHLHYEAWREYSKMLRGYSFTDEEMRERMFGHTNEDIIEIVCLSATSVVEHAKMFRNRYHIC